jgi:GNAT superfamily N-acetyltransferase
MTNADVLESNRLFIDAWTFWAERARAGEIANLPGLRASWMNVTWPVFNGTFLAEPVRDASDLAQRAQAAVSYAHGRDLGWVFFVCREMIPEPLRDSATEILATQGLTQVVELTGMSADRLLPSRRPAPDLEMRRVGSQETRRAFGEINALAYGDPVDLGIQALDVETLWGEGTFGVVGFLEGQPVTTAETIVLDGTLYVALVATLPEHQKKGYAEAAMRHSLALAHAATGLERTVLHASEVGLPLYREMGYQPVARFLGLIAGDGGGH